MSQPTYNLLIHPRANEELTSVPDEIETRATKLLKQIKTQRDPFNHPKIRKLVQDEGPDLYRARIGQYRIILFLDKPDLKVLSIEKRETDYRKLETAIKRLKA